MFKKYCSLFIILLLLQGCISIIKPTVIHTTFKTLQAAKKFRESGLTLCGEYYKQDLIDEETKNRIVKLGNELQASINECSKSLYIYYEMNDKQRETSQLKLKIQKYQQVYGKFVDIVLPYLIEETEVF